MVSSELINGMKSYLLQKIKDDPEFVKDLGNFIVGMASVPQNIRDFSEKSAAIGWFITSESYMANMKKAFDEGQEKLDSYMIAEIDHNYSKIKESLLQKHENRKHILSVAFDLYEQQNWISCIPLFLSQTEGIFSENVGSLLFSEHDLRKQKLQERFKDKAGEYMPYLYTPFESKTQFSAGISSASDNKKKNGPNRNGILHGSRKHLDYGTKINGYKCISLLSYVSMVFNDLEEKT
ncbi:hypothetical protein [Saccharospirillum alexandrii]|uniref:hypothetical protein n=1 Tax=Saccharospirillum alexandrii TaxID=2448477 RepID=UPI000FDCD6CC|nr:hypothetical protein [Saccharospirillum alexandrii]